MSDLIPIEKINALQVFTEEGIDPFLAKIRIAVSGIVPDVKSAKGRAEIKTLAYQITLRKGAIDRAGAELVKGWKAQAKVVDDSRRKARDFLDKLSTEIRQPLTEYEEETARMQAEADHKKMIREAHDAALIDHDIWLREKTLAEKEATIQAEEEERQREEDARNKAEKTRLENERIRKEAEEKAKKAGAEKLRLAGLRAQKATADKKLLLEKTNREKKEAAEKAEKDAEEAEEEAQRLIAEAVERAEKGTREAVEAERLRLTKEQEERTRIADEQAEGIRKAEEVKKASDDYRREINQGALAALLKQGIEEPAARHFITIVFQGKIPGIRMTYL